MTTDPQKLTRARGENVTPAAIDCGAGATKSVGLTRRQRECLEFIRLYTRQNDGVAPSHDELRAGLGYATKSAVSTLIAGLERRGCLRRLVARSRALEVLTPKPDVGPIPIYDAETQALRGFLNP